jgi:hypothetical protein
MEIPLTGLAALLCTSLGPRWRHLHPDIRARFTLAPGALRQSFTGTMNVVERSPLGWLIARLITFIRVLPAARARNVKFEFNLTAAPGGGWIKERLYQFESGPFEFRSVMRIESTGELVENFAFGLCMKIRLVAEDDTLYFLDDGYFLRIGQARKLRLPIPRWLGVGRFTLTHKNLDRDHFTVSIRLQHPLFGCLFYQRGTFQQAQPCAVANPAVSVGGAPDPALSATRGSAYC